MVRVRRLWVLLFLLILLVVNTTVLSAKEGLRIEDIRIVGLTRTDESIVRAQLPFAEGDLWEEEYRQWTLERLMALSIFGYDPMRVIVEPLSEHVCRVVVRLMDPTLFYREPVEFAMMTSINLLSGEFSPTLYNPFGRGQNLNLHIRWGQNYSYGGTITSPLGPGLLNVGGRYYQRHSIFEEKEFISGGIQVETGYSYWWSHSLRQTTDLMYHSFELHNEEFEYVLPRLSLFVQDEVDAELNLLTGLSLVDDPFFWQAQALLFYETGPLRGLLRGGYTCDATPDSYGFAIGGFGLLPLRGEGMYLRQGYGLGTLEYHHPLDSMFTPILFLDGGWLWDGGDLPTMEDGLFTIGLGGAVDTPLGVPVRFDIAANPMTRDWGFNVGFGHTFRAPF